MRITNNLVYNPFQQNLQDIQSSIYNDNTRITSGKKITNIADDPKSLVESKQLSAVINQNDSYVNNIADTLSEMRAAEGQMTKISDNIELIRQSSIDATNVGNTGHLPTLGDNIKGMIDEMVTNANGDFNGKFLFSGTLTKAESIQPTGVEKTTNPFEIVNVGATQANPSGLEAHFKGNLKDRVINQDGKTTEVINSKADELFGANGTEVFDTAIQLYNLLKFKSDGTPRQDTDTFTVQDQRNLDSIQQKLAGLADNLNNANAMKGATQNRLDSLSSFLTNQNLLLKDINSAKSDTDVAKVAMNLQKENTALQYTLQVGSKLIQTSLFDFLR